MSISTKGGDTGMTSLWSGQRIKKSDIRVESYGTVDELDSHLGEAKHFVKITQIRDILEEVQNKLMIIMGELASLDKQFDSPIQEIDVDKLTDCVHHFEAKVQLKGFVILGNTLASAKLDVCRTIARRAERRIIELNNHSVVNPHLIAFVNRLSDLLYIMAREEERNDGGIKYKNREAKVECKNN
ncbi:MAG: cob(I)yrinic acid a,c-diamide adenosyltransferase [Candidatus Cloacimonadales bacterium]